MRQVASVKRKCNISKEKRKDNELAARSWANDVESVLQFLVGDPDAIVCGCYTVK